MVLGCQLQNSREIISISLLNLGTLMPKAEGTVLFDVKYLDEGVLESGISIKLHGEE